MGLVLIMSEYYGSLVKAIKVWQKIMEEKDKCVMCGCDTEYDKDEHVDMRNYYVDGAGQLCYDCYKSVYDRW